MTTPEQSAPRRITGIENEWSIVYDDPLNKRYVPISRAQIILLIEKHLPEYLTRSDDLGMMSNGARLYRDSLDFLETASAEEVSLQAAVAGDIASERIVAAMVHSAIQAGHLPSSSRVNKRVVGDRAPDATGGIHTWGYHVSFAADSKKLRTTDDRMSPLAAHLASMDIYAGAGILRPYDPNHAYVIGQKKLNLSCNFSTASHGTSQPLISDRNEAHAADENLRIHVTSMDPHISPWATWMSLGTTSIVIRLMENGYTAEEFMKDSETDPYVIAREVARDPSLKNEYSLRGGKRMSAIDMQDRLYKQAESIQLSDEERAVMKEWKRALDTLKRNPLELTDADWVMRYNLIRNKTEKADVGLGSNIARYWNDEYDLVYEYPKTTEQGVAKRSLVNYLRARSFSSHLPPEELISDRMESAPSDTRAAARAELIKQYIGRKGLRVDWSKVTYEDEDDDGTLHEFKLGNPYTLKVDYTKYQRAK